MLDDAGREGFLQILPFFERIFGRNISSIIADPLDAAVYTDKMTVRPACCATYLCKRVAPRRMPGLRDATSATARLLLRLNLRRTQRAAARGHAGRRPSSSCNHFCQHVLLQQELRDESEFWQSGISIREVRQLGAETAANLNCEDDQPATSGRQELRVGGLVLASPRINRGLAGTRSAPALAVQLSPGSPLARTSMRRKSASRTSMFMSRNKTSGPTNPGGGPFKWRASPRTPATGQAARWSPSSSKAPPQRQCLGMCGSGRLRRRNKTTRMHSEGMRSSGAVGSAVMAREPPRPRPRQPARAPLASPCTGPRKTGCNKARGKKKTSPLNLNRRSRSAGCLVLFIVLYRNKAASCPAWPPP